MQARVSSEVCYPAGQNLGGRGLSDAGGPRKASSRGVQEEVDGTSGNRRLLGRYNKPQGRLSNRRLVGRRLREAFLRKRAQEREGRHPAGEEGGDSKVGEVELDGLLLRCPRPGESLEEAQREAKAPMMGRPFDENRGRRPPRPPGGMTLVRSSAAASARSVSREMRPLPSSSSCPPPRSSGLPRPSGPGGSRASRRADTGHPS